MRNRRKVLRHLFGVAAKLSDSEDPVGLDVRVVNISSEGCCVETSGTLKVGERRVLVIGWRGTEIRAEVAVVWSDAPTPSGRAGLTFCWVRPEDQPTLLELCSTLAIQPASPPADSIPLTAASENEGADAGRAKSRSRRQAA